MIDKAYDRQPTERSREFQQRHSVISPRTAKLVIELDGGQHGSQADYDSARTAFLNAKGYRVIRFWNNDVLGNLEGVATVIARALSDRPSPNPSRDAGGEKARSTDEEGQ